MPLDNDALALYKQKRDFAITPEPAEGGTPNPDALQFVIQKHWATRLHYDLRLEIDGTMKSWAVPKGPSLDPADKRMAVQVEDHPISYNTFEGEIPAHQYGAGRVIVWDRGCWVPVGDPAAGWREGKLKFELHGHKLHGHWTLVRMHGRAGGQKPAWLLIKEHDAHARPAAEFSVTDQMPDSVGALPAVATPVGGQSTVMPPAKQPAVAFPAGRPTPKVTRAAAGRTARDVPRAAEAPLPDTLAPQLATLVAAPPQDTSSWLFELKFDGYRILARIAEGGDVRLFTRSGNDWTARLPALAKAVAALPLRSGWLDGEILVLDAHGVPDFQALQNAFDGTGEKNIVYFLFDLPWCDGRDLRPLPLLDRRELLRATLKDNASTRLRFSEAFEARPQDLIASACKIGFEGVIGKLKAAPYASGRSADWIKLKCSHRQEFVIGGYTDPKGARTALGSLLLGVHDAHGALHYAGNVGTGFDTRTLVELKRELDALARTTPPFANPRAVGRKAHWVEPTLLAEVSFAEWTADNRIRHAVFHGLRTDKPATAIVRERPVAAPVAATATATATGPGTGTGTGASVAPATPASAAAAPSGARRAQDGGSEPRQALLASVQISHGERVVDASTGVTKLDLVRHCAAVAPLMMEYLRLRPIALMRAPDGLAGELFFQKHQERGPMAGVRHLDPALDPGHAPLLEVAEPRGLLSAAQMNVVEFHTWNATSDRIERPDRMTFDLDPGEGVPWPQVQEAAQLLRVLLRELGLPAFLKTSGGKGLHVVVPLQRRHGWDSVKDFSEAIVQHLARTIPQRFVARSGPRNRIGKIFVDYLRNGRGATTVCAWSARARPGLGVSVPVAWDELEQLTGGAHWTVRTVEERLSVGNAPWHDYTASAAALGKAMTALGYKP